MEARPCHGELYSEIAPCVFSARFLCWMLLEPLAPIHDVEVIPCLLYPSPGVPISSCSEKVSLRFRRVTRRFLLEWHRYPRICPRIYCQQRSFQSHLAAPNLLTPQVSNPLSRPWKNKHHIDRTTAKRQWFSFRPARRQASFLFPSAPFKRYVWVITIDTV